MTYGLAVSKAVVRLYFLLHFAHYSLSSSHTISAHSNTVLHYNPFPSRFSLISLQTASILARYMCRSSSQKFSLAMISIAGDVLILISTVLSTQLVKLKEEESQKIFFPADYLIQHSATAVSNLPMIIERFQHFLRAHWHTNILIICVYSGFVNAWQVVCSFISFILIPALL
jgi:hypothetical protein